MQDLEISAPDGRAEARRRHLDAHGESFGETSRVSRRRIRTREGLSWPAAGSSRPRRGVLPETGTSFGAGLRVWLHDSKPSQLFANHPGTSDYYDFCDYVDSYSSYCDH
eukprot:4919479-Pyramimonas_sp.AAC.1